MKLGHFTAEALQEFAEMKGLDTGNQDFSEGVFDFKVCEKPNGKRYGIPDQDKCRAPNREAKGAPLSVLGLNVGAKQNYDTAKSQGEAKTVERRYYEILNNQWKKGKALNEKLTAIDKFKITDDSTIKLYVKAKGKLLEEMASFADSQAKELRTILSRVPNETKPILQKIIDLEAQQSNALRTMIGLNDIKKDGTPINPDDHARYSRFIDKFSKNYYELQQELYPTLTERLKNRPLS